MAILHKNITASTDIHIPKWLPDANNGDYAFKNEKGELETIDELLLPAALNFVDGSVAPPTTNSGDIYILSSGGSVNAGWGSVSLQDWVRYDGTAWNSLTPQKSSLCYDKNADSLMSFNGVAWSAVGGGGGAGNTIYSANDSLTGDRIVDQDNNTLSFTNSNGFLVGASSKIAVEKISLQGQSIIKGDNTLPTVPVLQIYDGDSTPSSLWDFRNNGDVILGKDSVITLNNNIKIEGGQTYIDSGSFNPLVINRKASGVQGNGIDFNAYNSSNVETNFARIVQVATDATAGSEDGGLWLRTKIAGVLRTPVILDNREFLIDAVNFTDNFFRIKDGSIDCLTVNTNNQTYIESGSHNPLVINRKGAGTIGNGIDFNAYNSASSEHNFARVIQVATSATAGSEKGALLLRVSVNGTITTKVSVKHNTVNMVLPTSSSGLSSGDLWNDGGTVKIV